MSHNDGWRFCPPLSLLVLDLLDGSMLNDEIVYTFTAPHMAYVLYIFATGFIFCYAMFMLFDFWIKVGKCGARSEPNLGPVEVCTNLPRQLSRSEFQFRNLAPPVDTIFNRSFVPSFTGVRNQSVSSSCKEAGDAE